MITQTSLPLLGGAKPRPPEEVELFSKHGFKSHSEVVHSHFFAVGTLGERVEAEFHPLQRGGVERKTPVKQNPAPTI